MELKEVCGIKMGGEPGECPTLMIVSIFFDGHGIVKDSGKGDFDAVSASALIKEQGEWSLITGLPACIDIVASTTEAMEKYVEFVVGEFDGPVMIDGSDADVKIAGVKLMAKKGVAHRIIYNSISPETVQKELDAIKECGVKTAITLLVDSNDFTGAKKIDLMNSNNGPVAFATEHGIENIFIDPGVIDLPSVATAREIYGKANELGYYCGAGIHNAIGTWGGLQSKIGNSFKPAAIAVLNALSTAWNGDFVLYGPIGDARIVFPAVAMVDAVLAQGLLDKGKLPNMEHPLFKIA